MRRHAIRLSLRAVAALEERRGQGVGLSEGLNAARLQTLRIEHRDLDAAIAALAADSGADQLQMARLKKRKLRLRDEIVLLEDRMIPDITA